MRNPFIWALFFVTAVPSFATTTLSGVRCTVSGNQAVISWSGVVTDNPGARSRGFITSEYLDDTICDYAYGSNYGGGAFSRAYSFAGYPARKMACAKGTVIGSAGGVIETGAGVCCTWSCGMSGCTSPMGPYAAPN